jgi:hypothetical protein
MTAIQADKAFYTQVTKQKKLATFLNSPCGQRAKSPLSPGRPASRVLTF